jgi:UDP-glucose 4-epimerase
MEEALLGSEERYRAIDSEDYFRVPVDARNLDYQIYFDKGQDSLPTSNSYTSSNTKQLSVKEVVDMISNLPEFIRYKSEI